MINLKLPPVSIILVCAVVACSTALPAPSATFENITRIRSLDLPPVALGSFVRGESLSAAQDRSLQIRADSLKPPTGESFSTFLRQTFEAELTAADRLDPDSSNILSAALTRSSVFTAGATSRGELGAIFTLQRYGNIVFEKELIVNEEWPSAFLGAVAITDAANHYTGLYAQLVNAVLKDEDFLIAVRN